MMFDSRTCQLYLLSQADIGALSPVWHAKVLRDLANRLGPGSDFPCPFSRNAFQKELLKFVFVKDMSDSSFQQLGRGLADYVELSRNWNGDINTAYPLLVAFSRNAVTAQTVEEYHEFGWKVLQKLHQIDPSPWPGDVGKDPDSPFWSMCFNGMPLFCNMSHPAHRIRRSRNLGEHFIFVINPRERFDDVAGDTASGRKMRAAIRGRIAAYNLSEHCLQLGTYGSGAVEWQQYGIIEENAERSEQCPFMFRNP